MSLVPLLLVTAAGQGWLLRRLRFDWLTIAIALGATALYFDYLGYTTITERNYDGSSQLDYIQIIAQQRRLPHRFECAVCGHPPLYYLLGALWSKVTLLGGWLSIERSLQWLSILLACGFVSFALLIVRNVLGAGAPARLATLLIVVWPTSVINSVRVHNDALAAPLLLAALYFTARWDERERPRDFVAALTMAALALLTKANGYTVSLTLLLLCSLRLRTASQRANGIKRCLALIAILGAAAATAVELRQGPREATTCEKVFGSACSGRGQPPVPDRLSRFVSFDLRQYLRGTDISADNPERDYFPNRVAKSSLFGSAPLGDEFAGKPRQLLAGVLASLLLILIAVIVLRLLLVRGLNLRRHRAYWLSVGVMVTSLLAFRIRAPNAHHEDFRHIFPVLVPLCIAYIASVERLGQRSPGLRRAGQLLALAMALASIAFFARVAT